MYLGFMPWNVYEDQLQFRLEKHSIEIRNPVSIRQQEVVFD